MIYLFGGTPGDVERFATEHGLSLGRFKHLAHRNDLRGLSLRPGDVVSFLGSHSLDPLARAELEAIAGILYELVEDLKHRHGKAHGVTVPVILEPLVPDNY